MSAQPPSPGESSYTFGPFRLQPGRRTLLQDEAAVTLGSRALDVLTALVERPGEVLTKRDLMSRAWPNMVVGEGSLKVAVSELRRVLGDPPEAKRYLVNLPGRGYMFVAPVAGLQQAGATAAELHAAAAPPPLPCLPFCPIGREADLAAVAAALRERRLVSIVGPGGIGKTTLAIAAAQALAASFEDGACFVDLSGVSDARFVPAIVAQALGVVLRSEDALTTLALALHRRRQLIVLDNCEGLLDATATLVTRLLGSAPGLRLLSTSREALRVAGETVHRLPPLAFPPGQEPQTAAQALGFPAVRLFVDRATIRDARFELAAADVIHVVDICRKLEGLPLAIELAASRVDAFGLAELAALLEDRLRLIQLSWRGGQPRHASLEATLDWSYELLTADERLLLQRLAVFSGDFTLGAVRAVAGEGIEVAQALEGLVAKSLVVSSIASRSGRYRLLDATRAYAAHKLGTGSDYAALRRRHASHVLAMLEGSNRGDGGDAPCLTELRCTIAWAASPIGEASLAVALRLAALPLWARQSLLSECRENVEQTLADERLRPWLGARERMQLKAALGAALLHTRGPQAGIAALWSEALAEADALQDVEHQLRMLWGLPLYLHFAGDYRGALGYLRRFRALAQAQGDAVDRLNGERLLGTTLLYLGRLSSARRCTERMLAEGGMQAGGSHIARFQFEPVSVARSTLANILWLQGHAEQALQTACQAVEDARRAEHPLSLLGALGQGAVPLALQIGDRAAADHYLADLADLLARHDLALFGQHARCLRSIAQLERGDLAGVSALEAAVQALLAAGFHLRRTHYLCALAKGQGLAGRANEALATIDAALDWCARSGERWYLPEALRLKGELLAAGAEPGRAAPWYERALRMARAQGALTWELRVAVSRVRLQASEEALATLRSVHGRFAAGFVTADLREAAQLLA